MTRTLSIAVVAVLAIFAGLTLFAAGTKVAAQETKAQVMSCPCCGMTMSNMKGGTDMSGTMNAMQSRMKEAGVSEEAMKAHMAMMNAPLYLDSPEMLLGQADTLGLTDDQKATLAEVAKDSRAKAAAVLTEAQLTQLGQVPEKPMTMMEMRAEMMKKMGKDKGMGGMMAK